MVWYYRMYRQRLAATQALTILQDLPSDWSGDENYNSETKEMMNYTVARVIYVPCHR